MTLPVAGTSRRVEPDLSVEVAGIRLKNPVMTASGTFGYGREYSGCVDLNALGAVVVKGTSLHPWPGNPPPRVVETPAGMLNAIGLENPGVDCLIRDHLPWLRNFDVPVIINVAGKTVAEYAEVARRLDGEPGVAGLELNVSCPNVKEGGLAFGTDPLMIQEVTRAVRRVTRLPLIVKLSPNVTSITEMARAAEDAGADALSLINALLGMAIDIRKRRPVLGNVVGGLSGPAVKPVALRMVWQVAEATRLPIVGLGGIMTAEDALEFIMAGATAVAVGTASFVNPGATAEVVDGLRRFLIENGIRRVHDLMGAARPQPQETKEEKPHEVISARETDPRPGRAGARRSRRSGQETLPPGEVLQDWHGAP